MSYRSRTRLAALAALVIAVAVAGVAYAFLGRGGPDPGPAIDAYLGAWSRGDDAGAARDTDRPAKARDALAESRRGLDGAAVTARRTALERSGDRATARVH